MKSFKNFLYMLWLNRRTKYDLFFSLFIFGFRNENNTIRLFIFSFLKRKYNDQNIQATFSTTNSYSLFICHSMFTSFFTVSFLLSLRAASFIFVFFVFLNIPVPATSLRVDWSNVHTCEFSDWTAKILSNHITKGGFIERQFTKNLPCAWCFIVARRIRWRTWCRMERNSVKSMRMVIFSVTRIVRIIVWIEHG